ncbi:hypothetical protein H257_12549 [Aphanomyces astaci]|uniref:BING4 C-terminal domain-containing protein n=1 Tax=Aphanomyces astaci TaxID=112090 RepID=W4G0E5_APHAT|nr:hypothetical protein H257_12549 [Aphanomyces astaci]ETV72413.1 hypothetical protein H257_12549 [Aphanomyces astaci]|eukprot:XP_009838095.1 hypothetical protein H257_12549 [Aphanomyces astaci]
MSDHSDTEQTDARRAPKRLGEDPNDASRKGAKKPKTKNVGKYLRPAPEGQVIRSTKDKKLKGELARYNKKVQDAAASAAKAEILLPEEAGVLTAEGMEKTFRFTQEQLAEHVDRNTAQKMFHLDLPTFGPYNIDYTKNGRNLILGGQKGHVAVFDTLRMNLSCEFHVKESVRDVKFLHNNSLFAVAQKKYVYIYDNTGAEAHCIRTMADPKRLAFLPYHFLLSCVSGNGLLSYNDITTGAQISTHKTKLGLCDTMALNPWNAVVNLGHANGLVTLWTPNMPDPVIKMQAHQGPIRGMAVHVDGRYLATTGSDRKLKIFDLRTYKELHQYYLSSGATTVDISHRGMVAVGFGPNVEVWKDALTTKAASPYMTHRMPGTQATSVRFRPFEDVLSIGHALGFANIVVPGAGEANFDSFEANPFENLKQRRETEVKSLLEKLRPEMITLNPMVIGRVDVNPNDEYEEKVATQYRANNQGRDIPKKKMRGKNRPSRRLRKKQQNVVDIEKQKYRDMLESKSKDDARAKQATEWKQKMDSVPTALNRFYKK